jgi:acyl carrier protein
MPNPLVPPERVEEEVKKALGKALRKDPAAIGMDQSIVSDLGGSSLDFLDVTFKLEQAFGIRMAHQVLLDHVEETFGEGSAIDSSGRLTAGAVEVLRMRLGDHKALATGMYADEVPALVTPRTLSLAVREVLDELPAACPACKASQWTTTDGAKVVCGACKKPAAYPDGDAVTKTWVETVGKQKGLFAAA